MDSNNNIKKHKKLIIIISLIIVIFLILLILLIVYYTNGNIVNDNPIVNPPVPPSPPVITPNNGPATIGWFAGTAPAQYLQYQVSLPQLIYFLEQLKYKFNYFTTNTGNNSIYSLQPLSISKLDKSVYPILILDNVGKSYNIQFNKELAQTSPRLYLNDSQNQLPTFTPITQFTTVPYILPPGESYKLVYGFLTQLASTTGQPFPVIPLDEAGFLGSLKLLTKYLKNNNYSPSLYMPTQTLQVIYSRINNKMLENNRQIALVRLGYINNSSPIYSITITSDNNSASDLPDTLNASITLFKISAVKSSATPTTLFPTKTLNGVVYRYKMIADVTKNDLQLLFGSKSDYQLTTLLDLSMPPIYNAVNQINGNQIYTASTGIAPNNTARLNIPLMHFEAKSQQDLLNMVSSLYSSSNPNLLSLLSNTLTANSIINTYNINRTIGLYFLASTKDLGRNIIWYLFIINNTLTILPYYTGISTNVITNTIPGYTYNANDFSLQYCSFYNQVNTSNGLSSIYTSHPLMLNDMEYSGKSFNIPIPSNVNPSYFGNVSNSKLGNVCFGAYAKASGLNSIGLIVYPLTQ